MTVALLASLLLFGQADLAPAVGPRAGSLVIDGGGETPQTREKFVALAGGPDSEIVLIPTATEGDELDLKRAKDNFAGRFGAKHVTVLHTRDRAEADTEAFVAPLKTARGVWFGGGRQWRLVDAYMGTCTEREIEAVLARGGVIGGGSAGATIQGSYLVRGAPEGNHIMMAKGHEKGFGYLRGVAIDQHLVARDRADDLVEVIDKKPELLGLGIDEPAAIVVRGDRFEVIGRSVVGIYDGKDHDGKRYYFLVPGEQFDLRSRKRIGGKAKASIRPSATASKPADPKPAAKPAIDAFIKAHADSSWEMARKIWEWAEVGFQEKRSAALLADAMEAGGFKVERGVAGIPTSFIASIGSGKPVIGILGEYDALPGLSQQAVPDRQARPDATAGHGCGHHLFGVASASACLALGEQIKAGSLKGTLRLYGCPAEEGGSAKAFMVRAQLFDDCDAVLHWHPSSQNTAGNDSSQARIAVKFRFHGTSSHAAGAPEVGRSALDAIELTNHAAELLREHTPDFTRIHHVVTAGGSAPNVVPDFGEVFYYVRHPRADVVQTLYPRLLKCAEAGGLATETRLETQYLGGILEILPNQTLGRVARANLLKLNDLKYDEEEARFADRIQKTLARPASLKSLAGITERTGQGGSGSTDVGDVSWVVPTAGFTTACWVPGTAAHSWQAVAAGGTTIGKKGMILAARVLAATGWDLFQSPALLRAAKAEHRQRLAGRSYHSLLGPDQKPPLDYRDAPGQRSSAVSVGGNTGQESPAARHRDELAQQKLGSWTSLGLGGGGAMYTPAISPADPNLILLSCDMSGAYRSTDGGRNWELIHYQQLTGSTRVRPVWHPSRPGIAFAVDGRSGLLKTTHDKGQTWSTVPEAPAGVTAIGIDPARPQLILAGNRRALFRSTDAGKSWEEVTAVRGRVLGFHCDQTSPIQTRTCFAATDQIILRSDDGGAKWREVATGFGASPILAFAGGSNVKSNACVLYCSVESRVAGGQVTGGIYRSADRGATWSRSIIDPGTDQAKKGLPRPMQYEFVVTADVNPSRVYASRGRDGQVFRSDDGGATWRETLFQSMKSPMFNVGPNYLIDERGDGGDTISGLGINPADPEHVIVTDWMDCFITKNGGKTWDTAHTRSAEVAGRRGKGMRWINNGLVVTTAWNYYLDPFEPNRHYIAYTDIGYARSTDAGKTWYWQTGRPLRNTTYELAFDPDTPGTIWAAFADLHDIPQNNVISGRHYRAGASGGVGVSTDFGKTWIDTSGGLPKKPMTSVVVDPKSPKGSRTLYASAFEDGVYKSTDGGKSWLKSSNGLGAPGVNVRACRIVLHRDGTLFCLVTALRKDRQYVALGPGLYRSTDGGKTWDGINRSQPLLWPKDYDVDPRDSRVIYLGAADAGNAEGGLYKTTDGGVTWVRIARKDRDCFGATVHPRKPDWVYLCIAEGETTAGLWLSKDAGKTWKALDGMPFRNAQRVSFDPNDDSVIYVSTFGGSVWRGPAE